MQRVAAENIVAKGLAVSQAALPSVKIQQHEADLEYMCTYYDDVLEECFCIYIYTHTHTRFYTNIYEAGTFMYNATSFAYG